MEKVSVIVPVYNGELTIEKCVRSILKLTCDTYSLEVIIVKNGSTDNTLPIVKGIAKEDNRVKVFLKKTKVRLVQEIQVWTKLQEIM